MCVCGLSPSVVSYTLWPHGQETARLFCPWNFSGKNTGVGCHFLLQWIFPTQGLNPCLLRLRHWQILYHCATDLYGICIYTIYVCIHIYIYIKRNISHKKEQNNAICSNMDRPEEYHTEWSKSDKEKTNITWYHLYVESNNNTNETTYKTESDSQT